MYFKFEKLEKKLKANLQNVPNKNNLKQAFVFVEIVIEIELDFFYNYFVFYFIKRNKSLRLSIKKINLLNTSWP